MTKKKKPKGKEVEPCEDLLTELENQAEVAKLSVGTVAMIAATLSCPEMKAHECVIKAYEILEVATHGQLFLANLDLLHFESDAPDSNVVGFLKANWTDEAGGRVIRPEDKYVKYDASHNPLPIPFYEALKAIDPRPGKAINRLPRFRQWLMDTANLPVIAAGEKIAAWIETGIPARVFKEAFHSFPKWRKWRTSENNKVSAAKSREAKKGKQAEQSLEVLQEPPKRGRQGRRKSKNDGRGGAKLPGEKSTGAKKTR
jgi:hypothetical protein